MRINANSHKNSQWFGGFLFLFSFFWMFSGDAVFAASDGPAKVDRDARDAVVVINLVAPAPPQQQHFYQIVETFTVSESSSKLPAGYHEVAILTDEKATLTGLESTLARMAAREQTRAIDLYVHLHGGPGVLVFDDGTMASADIAKRFITAGRYQNKLRAVYSAACYGKTQAPDWLTAGFRVAGGAIGVNADSAYDLPVFISNWFAGVSFADTETKANDPNWIKFYDGIATNMGFSDANSFKAVDGDGTLTIDQQP